LRHFRGGDGVKNKKEGKLVELRHWGSRKEEGSVAGASEKAKVAEISLVSKEVNAP